MNKILARLPRTLPISFGLLLGATLAQGSAPRPPLTLIKTIPLPALHEGDFDHFAPDLAGHRIFLAGEANGVVEVFDTRANEKIATIPGFTEPHSILVRSDLGRIFVVDGGASEIRVFDAKTYKPMGTIRLTIDSDSMNFDPRTGYMYVVNGGRQAKTPYSLISVVDTASQRKLADITIPTNWLEAVALAPTGPRLFVSMTGIGAIDVLDRNTHATLATWKLPSQYHLNVSLQLDEANHRLFTYSRNPASFLVINADTGGIVASLPAAPLVDDLAYDAATRRLYLPGDGQIDIFHQDDADHYSHLATIPSAFRAKTALLVPQWHRYYLAVPRHGNQPAEVRVFSVNN